jgi:hypothetical protein
MGYKISVSGDVGHAKRMAAILDEYEKQLATESPRTNTHIPRSRSRERVLGNRTYRTVKGTVVSERGLSPHEFGKEIQRAEASERGVSPGDVELMNL